MLALYDSCSKGFFYYFFINQDYNIYQIQNCPSQEAFGWLIIQTPSKPAPGYIPLCCVTFSLQWKKRTWKLKLPGTNSESWLRSMSKQIYKGNKLLSKARFFITGNSISAQKKHAVQHSCLVNKRNLDFYLFGTFYPHKLKEGKLSLHTFPGSPYF